VFNILAEQVSYLFVVDFQVRSVDEIFDTYGHLNSLKDVIKCPDKQTHNNNCTILLQQFRHKITQQSKHLRTVYYIKNYSAIAIWHSAYTNIPGSQLKRLLSLESQKIFARNLQWTKYVLRLHPDYKLNTPVCF